MYQENDEEEDEGVSDVDTEGVLKDGGALFVAGSLAK